MSDLLRLRLDISYDGTDFSGWAIQPGLRTVAGELTDALQVLLRQPVRLVVAGRTDAGVHAVGQVAHVDVDAAALGALAPRRAAPITNAPIANAPITNAVLSDAVLSAAAAPIAAAPIAAAPIAAAPIDAAPIDAARQAIQVAAGRTGLLRRLAGVLPHDVRVRRVSTAPNGFDARFSALRRHYRYRIGTGEWGVEPADRRYVLARRRELDTEAMSLAASAMIGIRDFAAFCRPREGASTIRELQALTVTRAGEQVHVDVTADAFCHSMVRALVGSLMAVGELRVPTWRPAELLTAARRSSEIHVAPAHGLTLLSVDYPRDDQLAERSLITRSTRSVDTGS